MWGGFPPHCKIRLHVYTGRSCSKVSLKKRVPTTRIKFCVIMTEKLLIMSNLSTRHDASILYHYIERLMSDVFPPTAL